jgi:hypothetical protein
MFVKNVPATRWILLGLAGAMAATRFHHADAVAALPDASLAVFFLAGLYLRQAWSFALLLAGAFLIDYLAIRYGGVSDWCVTPAYIFLVPTYAALWGAGRACAPHGAFGLSALRRTSILLIGGTTLAFLVSNGSFYLFSGRFPSLDWTQYGLEMARHYPAYLVSTVLYSASAMGLHALIAWMPRLRSWQA